ncbi:MAG: hypothetical protein KDE28_05245 [Anaerolineales bacterium]|nr:hypothetical protein [Anaerolineales bacterium]
MFDQLVSWPNLYLAFRKAAKGKRGLPNVAAFEYSLEENLLTLQEQLISGCYVPGAYHSFWIHEPKRRLISAAPFRDRVVHHALCNVIESIFEKSFSDQSYANRIGKGTHRALAQCQALARRYPYVLQGDLQQFFPSLDHAVLRGILWRKVPDERVRELIEAILASGATVLRSEYRMVYFPGDDLFAVNRPRGLPIGNLTSQFWANCYLNPFDHFVQRELGCGAYLRFVDDFVCFADNKAVLWKWLAEIQDKLAQLRLTLHPGAGPKPVEEGIPFLGFITFPDRRRLKRRKGIYFRRRFARQVRQYEAGEIPLDELGAVKTR